MEQMHRAMRSMNDLLGGRGRMMGHRAGGGMGGGMGAD